MKKITTIAFLNFTGTFLSLLIPVTSHSMSDLEFVHAAQCGDLQAVKEALPRANIDARVGDSESTALRQACQNGHLAVAKLLLEANAQPHILDKDNFSPLEIASLRGHYDVVDLLLKNGALITINVRDYAGR